jgi:hypothetical protein
MKKEERIARYGEEAYERYLEQRRAWGKAHKKEEKARKKKYREEHKEEAKAQTKRWQEEHPEKVKANSTRSSQEQGRKGGKYYDITLEDNRTGLRGERNKIRTKHGKQYRPYKMIIAPDSQIHHEWIPDTSEYRGVALVEAEQHMHGIVDVIEILEGSITLLTEEEVKRKQIKKSG